MKLSCKLYVRLLDLRFSFSFFFFFFLEDYLTRVCSNACNIPIKDCFFTTTASLCLIRCEFHISRATNARVRSAVCIRCLTVLSIVLRFYEALYQTYLRVFFKTQRRTTCDLWHDFRGGWLLSLRRLKSDLSKEKGIHHFAMRKKGQTKGSKSLLNFAINSLNTLTIKKWHSSTICKYFNKYLNKL